MRTEEEIREKLGQLKQKLEDVKKQPNKTLEFNLNILQKSSKDIDIEIIEAGIIALEWVLNENQEEQ